MDTDAQVLEKQDGDSTAQAPSLSDSKRFFARNTTSQVACFVFNAITSICMVPYVIHNLGMASYGMVTLANQVVNWTQPAATAIIGPLGRFTMLHMAKGENDKARSYFGTQFTAITYAFALLLPIAVLVSYFAPALFAVPHGLEVATRWIFFLTFLGFLLWLFTLTFQVSTYVTQRFYIKNLIEITNQTLRYGTWIVLFAIAVPALWQIGVGYVIGAFAAAAINVIVFRKLTPHLWSKKREFDGARFREVVTLGSWVALGQVGSILYFSCDAAIINRTLGLESVGHFGVVAGLAMMARTVSGNLAGFIGPPVVTQFAQQNLQGITRIVARSIKFVSLMFAITLGVACGVSEPFLQRWIGPEFGWLSVLMWIMLSHLVFNLGMDSAASVPNAMNRYAPLSIAIVCGGVLKVALAVVFIRFTSWGLVGIAIADVISHTAKNLVFLPFYSGKLLKTSSWSFYRALMPAAVVFPATALSSFWVANRFHLSGYPSLFVAGMSLMLVFSVLAFLTVLNTDDKRFLWEVSPLRRLRKPAS